MLINITFFKVTKYKQFNILHGLILKFLIIS